MEQKQKTEQEMRHDLREAEKAINRAFWLTIWDGVKFPVGIIIGLLIGGRLSRK